MYNKPMKGLLYMMTAVIAFTQVPMQADAAVNGAAYFGSAIGTGMSRTVFMDSLIIGRSRVGMDVDSLILLKETEKKEALIPDAKELPVETQADEESVLKARSLAIAQVDNYVNIRQYPDEDSEVVGKLYANGVGDLLGTQDGWCKISSGSVVGYIKEEYCVTGMEANVLATKVGTRMATVTADGLFVRKQASTESSILGMVAYQDDLVVLQEGEGWIKVDAEDGEGWVSSDYVTLRTEYVYAESKEEERIRLEKEEEERQKALAAAKAKKQAEEAARRAVEEPVTYSPFVLDPSTANVVGDSELGTAVAEYALQYVGNPYVYGGTSLTEGADCSGFVMSVYANFGVDLPHSSSADRKQGAKVDGIENAQAGDIVCYSGHVALYIGEGKIVHAANAKNGIVVSPADYKTILEVRRIF